MKTNITSLSRRLALALLVGLSASVKADINAFSSSTNIAWLTESNPIFYASTPLTSLSGAGAPGAASGAAASSLSEVLTITNGAGTATGAGPGSGTNYELTGIGMIVSGYSSTTVTLHIYDITGNLSAPSGQSIYNSTSATYTFTSPNVVGDLLGEGTGLSFTNNHQSGAEQVAYVGLQNGPNTYGDEVILASNHTYAFEISVPTTSQIFWFKNTTADAGGQAMGSVNAAPNATREAIAPLGLAGGSRTFAIALYGTPTTLLAPSSNSSTNIVLTTNIWIDQFNALSVSPGNPLYTNAAVGTVDYSQGEIGEIWSTWFGDAVNITWDNTNDAQFNTNGGLGGSMLLQDNMAAGGQIMVYDGANAFSPLLDGADFTSFECDVMFDASSAVQTNASGLVYFGNLQFGTRTASYAADEYNGNDFQIQQAMSNQWVHIKIPLSAASDSTLDGIYDILIHIYGPFGAYPSAPAGDLQGNVKFWVDNIKFKAPLTVPLVPPPTLQIQKAQAGTARFWTTAPQYTRTELATSDLNQSWIGGPGDSGDPTATYSVPVNYSFTLSHLTTDSTAQTTLWLVDNDGGTYNGNDYSLGTELWLNITASPGNGWTGAVAWKANDPGANPTNNALLFTNSVGVGTWTLTFTGETNGSLLAPGWQTASNFTIADPNAAGDFANPMTALIGIQGNGSSFGAYDDFTQVSIIGVAGVNETDIFTGDSVLQTNASGYWSEGYDTGTASGYSQITNAAFNGGAGFTSAYPATVQAIFLVTTNTPYWVTWNVTTNGYGLAESATGALPITGLASPAFFSSYTDLPEQCITGGTNWALMPLDCLPAGKAGFFEVVNPPPFQ
jgi:hypothetical protein